MAPQVFRSPEEAIAAADDLRASMAGVLDVLEANVGQASRVVGPLYEGQQVWEWTVLDLSVWKTDRTRRRRAALVRCSCGVEKLIHKDHLRSGNTKSCGHGVGRGQGSGYRLTELVLRAIKDLSDLGYARSEICELLSVSPVSVSRNNRSYTS